MPPRKKLRPVIDVKKLISRRRISHDTAIRTIKAALTRPDMDVDLHTFGTDGEFRCVEVGWVIMDKDGNLAGGSCFQRGPWEPHHAYAILAVEMLYLELTTENPDPDEILGDIERLQDAAFG